MLRVLRRGLVVQGVRGGRMLDVGCSAGEACAVCVWGIVVCDGNVGLALFFR